MTERLKYFDFLKGIAIIGVVAIHSTGIGYSFPDSSFDFNVTVIWRQLINFSVPMFIAISGFFLANKDVSTHLKYFEFLKKQIPRVLVPYLIWSLLYMGIDLIRGENIGNIVLELFTFQTATPFYFIILIIEFYLLLPILQRLGSKDGLIISGAISILSSLAIFYFRYYTDIRLPLYIYGSAPSWLFFYTLGIYIKKKSITLKNKVLVVFLLIGFALTLLETYSLYFNYNSIGDSVTALKVSNLIYSSFLILLAFKNSEKIKNINKVCVYIGEISFGIFLTHMFFLIIINLVINKFLPFINQNAILKQIILIAIVTLCSLTTAVILRKINKSKAISILGQ